MSGGPEARDSLTACTYSAKGTIEHAQPAAGAIGGKGRPPLAQLFIR